MTTFTVKNMVKKFKPILAVMVAIPIVYYIFFFLRFGPTILLFMVIAIAIMNHFARKYICNNF